MSTIQLGPYPEPFTPHHFAAADILRGKMDASEARGVE